MQTFHIQAIHIENFKGLKLIDLSVDDKSIVQIAGRNGQGKSSLLDSIIAAIAGSKAKDLIDPIRTGERSATVKITLDDGTTIQKKWKRNGSPTLFIAPKPKGGEQTYLNSLFGPNQFDPLEFLRWKSKEQTEFFLRVLGIDFSGIELEKSKVYEQRTRVNQNKKMAEGQLSEYISVPPTKPVDVSILISERNKAQAHNRMVDDLHHVGQSLENEIAQSKRIMGEYDKQISDLLARIESIEASKANEDGRFQKLSSDLIANDAELSNANFIDTESIDIQIASASDINRRADHYQKRLSLSEKIKTLEDESDELTDKIKQCDDMKETLLADAKIPITGVKIEGDDKDNQLITVNRVPLAQCATSEQLIFTLMLATLNNPGIRDIPIKDASLLDENSFNLIKDYAEKNDIRFWLELVGERHDGAIVIEEGEIKIS